MHHDAQALAAIDAQGVLQWCKARFAALLAPRAALLQRLDQWLDPAAARRLMAGEAVEWQLPAGTAGPGGDTTAAPWRLQAGAPTEHGLQLVRAEPLGELAALRQRIDQLQARLDLVQTFSQTGVFERDATSLQGSWDAQMYRIWGLPERSPGALAPSRGEIAQHMLREDLGDDGFAQTLSRPGRHAQRVRIRRPDGQVRHLNTRWQVFHDCCAGGPRRGCAVRAERFANHRL